jgi:hypothetical protein
MLWAIKKIFDRKENAMRRKPDMFIMGLERLNSLNSEGCPACNRPFTLGDPAVLACGAWEGGPKIIHENEAVFDSRTNTYIERRCYAARNPTAN